LNFCIDTYEFPNQKGAIPIVMISWNDMKKLCEDQGKRICKDFEWEFACEGEEMLPYPYGLNRDATKCNIDKPWIPFDSQKLFNPKTRGEEVERLSQRVPSGSMDCKSPFGVYDMTGNVDEFVVNSSGSPYKSGLKGGHWAWGARNRARPVTLAHDENFAFYAEGGRCCQDINHK
jgi:formylglycine-generating enzyme required for sulfatase activity